LFVEAAAVAQQQRPVPWVSQASGTTASLRGIHAVGDRIAWASGTGGTVLRTIDGGATWQRCATPPDAEQLDVRGVWAWDANAAVVMTSGPGPASRLYATSDGGAHWTTLLKNPDPQGFFDALAFRSRTEGYVLGDAVGGRFVVLRTVDGGTTWQRVTAPGLETDGPATGAFAASNASLLALPLLFGTTAARAYRQRPDGSWAHVVAPLASATETAGIYAIAGGPDAATLVAVGGDYKLPTVGDGTAAWSVDGGIHWTAATAPPHGYRSTVAWDATQHVWISAGPNGSDVSADARTWRPLDDGVWNALGLPWIVGPNGRIAKLDPAAPR
jgi:photosystem II stability/assembly factor-like uncharacterized protein